MYSFFTWFFWLNMYLRIISYFYSIRFHCGFRYSCTCKKILRLCDLPSFTPWAINPDTFIFLWPFGIYVRELIRDWNFLVPQDYNLWDTRDTRMENEKTWNQSRSYKAPHGHLLHNHFYVYQFPLIGLQIPHFSDQRNHVQTICKYCN